MSCELDSGLPIHCAAALTEAKLALPQGYHWSFTAAPTMLFKTPSPSSWYLLVPPDLYSDQKDIYLHFAEKNLALFKTQSSRAPLATEGSFNRRYFVKSFTHFKVLPKCSGTSGTQKLLDVLPQASPPTETGLRGELSQFCYCHMPFKWFCFCPAVFLLTGRMFVPCLYWAVCSSDLSMT